VVVDIEFYLVCEIFQMLHFEQYHCIIGWVCSSLKFEDIVTKNLQTVWWRDEWLIKLNIRAWCYLADVVNLRNTIRIMSITLCCWAVDILSIVLSLLCSFVVCCCLHFPLAVCEACFPDCVSPDHFPWRSVVATFYGLLLSAVVFFW